MTRENACIILDVLEYIECSQLRQVVKDYKHCPTRVIAAWEELEKRAGRRGSAPCPEDFR